MHHVFTHSIKADTSQIELSFRNIRVLDVRLKVQRNVQPLKGSPTAILIPSFCRINELEIYDRGNSFWNRTSSRKSLYSRLKCH